MSHYSDFTSFESTGYTRRMPMKTDKMLAVLLALLLALAPISSALAASHSCGSDDGGMTDMDHHSAHTGMISVSLDEAASADQTDSCQDCSMDCCVSGACTSSVCGGAASAVVSALKLPLSFSNKVIPSDFLDGAITNRHNPPFRPPRA